MQPNTPHAVLTPNAAICHGGHYYATSTIRWTCYGVFIGFVLNSIITNTEHTSAAMLFFRRLTEYWHLVYGCSKETQADGMWIVVNDTGFWFVAGPLPFPVVHVPNVSMFEGLHDLFSLLNILELSNILHFKTYTKTGLTGAEWKEMIRGRLKAREIICWVLQNYLFEGEHSIESFYWSYLAYQTHALLNGKIFAEKDQIYSANEDFIAHQVQRLIK